MSLLVASLYPRRHPANVLRRHFDASRRHHDRNAWNPPRREFPIPNEKSSPSPSVMPRTEVCADEAYRPIIEQQ
jgi:hypothetical protein